LVLLVERGLQAGDGVLHAAHATEVAGGDFGGAAVAVEGLHLHQLRQRAELQDAALDVAFEQERQDLARGLSVLGEQVLRLATGCFSALVFRPPESQAFAGPLARAL
jgi:hypothetical protein